MIGADPCRIEDLFQVLWRGGFHRGGPGLGVDVDEERVRAAAEGSPPWRNPLWRNADGTVAEW